MSLYLRRLEQLISYLSSQYDKKNTEIEIQLYNRISERIRMRAIEILRDLI